MGIGRREFLRIFGSSLAALAASPTDAASVHGELYLNRRLGVGFEKPAGWEFVDVKTMGTMQKGTLLAIEDDVRASAILELMDLPFVTVAQPTEESTPVSPCIHFVLIDGDDPFNMLAELAHDLEDLLSEEEGKPVSSRSRMLQRLDDDIDANTELFRSYRVSSAPREFSLSKCDAAEYTASYLFEHQDLQNPAEVRQRTIYVKHRDASYLIRLVDCPAERLVVDFDPFIKTIVLA
jgi:hypothetical protein